MSKSVKGRRRTVAGGAAPPSAPRKAPPAPSPFAALLAETDVSEAARAGVQAASFEEREVGWIGALIQLFGPARDRDLLVVRKLKRALDMAIAYSLPDVDAVSEGNIARVEKEVALLKGLRFDDGGPVFAADSSTELSARLGELSAGLFDDVLRAGRPPGPISREDHVWRGTAEAFAAAEAAERAKFLQLGRVESGFAGSACPRCGSRNTKVMTLQLRSNDEAASSQFYCNNCGYAKTL